MINVYLLEGEGYYIVRRGKCHFFLRYKFQNLADFNKTCSLLKRKKQTLEDWMEFCCRKGDKCFRKKEDDVFITLIRFTPKFVHD